MVFACGKSGNRQSRSIRQGNTNQSRESPCCQLIQYYSAHVCIAKRCCCRSASSKPVEAVELSGVVHMVHNVVVTSRKAPLQAIVSSTHYLSLLHIQKKLSLLSIHRKNTYCTYKTSLSTTHRKKTHCTCKSDLLSENCCTAQGGSLHHSKAARAMKRGLRCLAVQCPCQPFAAAVPAAAAKQAT